MPDKATKKTRARRDLTLRPQTDAQIADAAAITHDSVLRAQVEYGRIAPAAFRALLDAPEIPETTELPQ